MLRKLGPARKIGAFRFDFGPERSPYRAPVRYLKPAPAGPVLLQRVERKHASRPWRSVGDGKSYWLLADNVYVTNTAELDLRPDDVRALVLEAENRKRLKLEKAHALNAIAGEGDTKARRQPIPQQIKTLVWQRDAGRCVDCATRKDLEFDHIIPLALGGSNTARNLQLLCAACNRRKGATLG
ncbi:MAG TPA: HNH endonuclease signature motif containing protein [Solirubrobacteraceae bacterium]|jgi:hypothetical protein|nr:HNH endonuclease signature motif containing protein [Solirubrobacteraceae bacterium]